MGIEELITYASQYVPIPLYANDFPTKAKGNVGFVRLEGGQPPHMYIEGLRYPAAQIMIRHEDERTAEKIAYQVWDTFNAKSNYMIGLTHVRLSTCDQSIPIYVGADNNGRTLYSINISFIVV